MDLFGPKAGPFGKTPEIPTATAKTPSQLACKLGGQVLLESFKVRLVLFCSRIAIVLLIYVLKANVSSIDA